MTARSSVYTDGGDLVDWSDEQGGLSEVPLETRLALVAEVAEALAAAHSVGVLHKDVKPQNVLITRDREGRPHARLADFGVGLVLDRDSLSMEGMGGLGFTGTLANTAAEHSGTWPASAAEVAERLRTLKARHEERARAEQARRAADESARALERAQRRSGLSSPVSQGSREARGRRTGACALARCGSAHPV